MQMCKLEIAFIIDLINMAFNFLQIPINSMSKTFLYYPKKNLFIPS